MASLCDFPIYGHAGVYVPLALSLQHLNEAPSAGTDASAAPHTHNGDHHNATPARSEAGEVLEGKFPMWLILTMVGAMAVLLLATCVTVLLVLRCRKHKKKV
jgi:hypothetical protein